MVKLFLRLNYRRVRGVPNTRRFKNKNSALAGEWQRCTCAPCRRAVVGEGVLARCSPPPLPQSSGARDPAQRARERGVGLGGVEGYWRGRVGSGASRTLVAPGRVEAQGGGEEAVRMSGRRCKASVAAGGAAASLRGARSCSRQRQRCAPRRARGAACSAPSRELRAHHWERCARAGYGSDRRPLEGKPRC